MRGEIVLVDARSTALTISWPPLPEAVYYLLEYRSMIENEWEMLADDLTLCEIRKAALAPKQEYVFRVAAIYDDDTISEWISHKEPFQPMSVEEDEDFSMSAPIVTKLNVPETLLVTWEAVEEDIYGFELQFRQNRGGQPWITISDSLTSNQVRKRNLKCKWGYQFRIRPTTDHKNEPFSPPSQPVAAMGVKSPFPAILMKGLKQQPQQGPPPQQQNFRPRPQPGRNAPPPSQQQSEDESYYEDGEKYNEGEDEPFVMDCPWFNKAEEPNALMICWKPVEYATGYELQMIKCMKKRAEWTTLAPNLTGTQVKKKNLTSKGGYQFRVRPNGFEEEIDFSPPSNIAIAN